MEREIIRYPNVSGVSFTERDIPSIFPPHWHNAAEFITVLKEGCRYRIDGTLYEPEAGDILLIWPRELHELIRIPEESVVFVQFSSCIIESNNDLVASSYFINKCHIIKGKENPELTEKIRDLIYKIRDVNNKKEYFTETRSKILVYQALLLVGEYVMKEYKESLGDRKFSNKLWDYIRYACSYIAEHSTENISQAEVAERTGLSQYYFSKLFKEYTKMSFPSYLSGIRVRNAINLLAQESMSVTDCAFEAGFQSTTTFNKMFREFTGRSPRDYRKLLS
ncbi:MAG: AraC family transcriptional regulator [Treponemataceae bacterium]|nr:AraC family transcriptional regulator [Treponemataceae bacterium]